MGVGMPQDLWLHDFGSLIWDAFGHAPYHVGSSLEKKEGWRDVDVRLILPDDEYARLGLGYPALSSAHINPKWRSLCIAYSVLGKHITGLPVDFQIQQQTWANEEYPDSPRSCLGRTPWRVAKSHSQSCLVESQPASSDEESSQKYESQEVRGPC